MLSNRFSLAIVVLLVLPGTASTLRAQSLNRSAHDIELERRHQPVRYSLSDDASEGQDSQRQLTQVVYPSHVSAAPGFPRKPLWERPGDFNGSHCMSPRYCQPEYFRAGWPKDQSRLATSSVNRHYFAWYVGGGSGLPFLNSRSRTSQEGTWGLDYSLWKMPRTVFMKWTRGWEQGGLGAYATDHEPILDALE